MPAMSDEKRQLPPWLIGLVLAVIVTVIALVVLNALGYGDDPAVGGLASASAPAVLTSVAGAADGR